MSASATDTHPAEGRATMTAFGSRYHVSPPAPATARARTNALSLLALALGSTSLLSLPLHVTAAGLLLGVLGLRRREALAKVAIVVCLACSVLSACFPCSSTTCSHH